MTDLEKLEIKLKDNYEKMSQLQNELKELEAEVNKIKSRGASEVDTSAFVPDMGQDVYSQNLQSRNQSEQKLGNPSVNQNGQQPVQPVNQCGQQPVQPVNQYGQQPVQQSVYSQVPRPRRQPAFGASNQPIIQPGQPMNQYGHQSVQNNLVYTQAPQQGIKQSNQYMPGSNPNMPGPNQYMPGSNPNMSGPNQKRMKSSKSDAESLLGRNVMGIAASVLIFISFILFATLLIPNLTDVMKISLMFIVSIGITAVGLIKWFPKKESTFFLSLTACGVGAIYISLFLCDAYFHVIGDILLYLLILGWAAGVLFLSKYKKMLFEIIGTVGIFISVMFGSYLCMKTDDQGMLMILSIYFVIGTLAYMLFRLNDDISFIINNVFGILGASMLVLSSMIIQSSVLRLPAKSVFSNGFDLFSFQLGRETEVYIISGIIGAFLIAMIVLGITRINDSNKNYIPLISIFYSLILYFDIALGMYDKTVAFIVMLLLSVVLYASIEYFISIKRDEISGNSVALMIWQVILFIASLIFVTNIKGLSETVGITIIAVMLLVYGLLADHRLSNILGLVSYGLLIFGNGSDNVLLLVIVVGIFALINIIMYLKKNQYSAGIKCASYSIFVTGLFICFALMINAEQLDSDLGAVLILFVIGTLNACMMKTPYGKSWITYDEELSSRITGYVINAIFMFLSLIFMNEVKSEIAHAVIVLGAIALFFLNVIRFMKSKKAVWEVYVGVKFMVLVIAILGSYHSPQYVISIAIFIVAILVILLGFKINVKSIRIYGLVVSMICVVKLVMVDITYSNTMGHALSFFISGVLCFVISALYNIADKRYKGS